MCGILIIPPRRSVVAGRDARTGTHEQHTCHSRFTEYFLQRHAARRAKTDARKARKRNARPRRVAMRAWIHRLAAAEGLFLALGGLAWSRQRGPAGGPRPVAIGEASV